ncbi:MAG: bifunctional 5,10-methylenetetrahydrofolate dehydrogenase/5,10-methenyltetrahydrofolate cyclohydrolase [Candidatus Moraniibacteriota bacterium]
MALLYGKPIADKILSETQERIAAAGIAPGLAVILVGDDTSSHLYVNLKEKAAQAVGIYFEKFLFPAATATDDVTRRIDTLNQRGDIHGIIVQLPLPEGLDTDEIIARIDPNKDTDGFHEETLRRFFTGDIEACPVFPRAMLELLRTGRGYYIGEKGLVIANSDLLGKIMAQALALEGLASEYILSSEKKEIIAEKTQAARVVVTACGIANLITGEMLAPESIVIDGGISHLDGKVVGDVHHASVVNKAKWLSPVPGGVGPVTVASLLARVTDAALKKN